MEGSGRDLAQLLISWESPASLARICSVLNQARVLRGEGGGSTPRGCALTMPPWLAVPMVPTQRGSPHGPSSGLAAVTSGTGSDTSCGTASFLE